VDELKKTNPVDYQMYMEIKDPVTRTQEFVEQMKKYGIDYIIPITDDEETEDMFAIQKKFSEKFPGVIPLSNPETHKDPKIMDELVRKGALMSNNFPVIGKGSDFLPKNYYHILRKWLS
jgi:hypothetical protein